MPERGVDNLRPLAEPAAEIGPDGRVAAFHLVIGRLADIVQQPASTSERCRSCPISSAIMPVRYATSIECRRTFCE